MNSTTSNPPSFGRLFSFAGRRKRTLFGIKHKLIQKIGLLPTRCRSGK